MSYHQNQNQNQQHQQNYAPQQPQGYYQQPQQQYYPQAQGYYASAPNGGYYWVPAPQQQPQQYPQQPSYGSPAQSPPQQQHTSPQQQEQQPQPQQPQQPQHQQQQPAPPQDRYAAWSSDENMDAQGSAGPSGGASPSPKPPSVDDIQVEPTKPEPSAASSSSSSSSSSRAKVAPALGSIGRNNTFRPNNPGPVFNMPLRAVMVDQGKGYIPFIVEKGFLFLKKSLKEEGLFRIAGSKTTVDKMVAAFDAGEDVELSRYTQNAHDVASLLKRFFRELPDPLVSHHLYEAVLQAQKLGNKAEQLDKLHRICDQLPEYNHALLECLLVFLNEVAARAAENKMSVKNLATVFGPVLMRRKGECSDGTQELRDAIAVNEMAEVLIRNVEGLFGIHHLDGSIDSFYHRGEELGSGAFATVYAVTHRDTGEKFAAKFIEKKSLAEIDQLRLKTEVDILKRVRHPGVIALKAVCETSKELILVMELASGGELFEKLVSDGKYCEADAVRILQQIISAVEYLHDLNIVHRDLKPENILLKSANSKEVKIADFGLSKIFDDAARMGTVCGSPGYVAPEVLLEDIYGKPVDMWSIGVIAYVLLSGVPPFFSENIRELFQQIMACDYRFPSQYWSSVSEEAKDFVRSLLVLEPEKRLTARQALQHPFLTGRSQTLDAIKVAAILGRTKQLQREVSVRATQQYFKPEQKPPSSSAGGAAHAAAGAGAASSAGGPNRPQKNLSAGKMEHEWKRTNYHSPTWCDFCTEFLWGLRGQGYKCKQCGLDLHKKCCRKLGATCIGGNATKKK